MTYSRCEQVFKKGCLDRQALAAALKKVRLSEAAEPASAAAFHKRYWQPFLAAFAREEVLADELLYHLSVFIGGGAFPLDTYELKMLKALGRLAQNTPVALASVRTESFVRQHADAIRSTLAGFAASGTVPHYLNLAKSLLPGADIGWAFRSFPDAEVTVDATHGVAKSDHLLWEQPIMNAIALEEFCLSACDPYETLAAAIQHFFFVQYILEHQYPQLRVLEMAGRRLPLTMTLLVQTAWLQLRESFGARPFQVSSLALGAFYDYLSGCDHPVPGGYSHQGTLGHKLLSFVETSLRAVCSRDTLPPPLQPWGKRYSRRQLTFAVSLAAEVVGHRIYHRSFPEAPLILPDLHGAELGLAIWQKLPSSGRPPLTLRQDSSFAATIDILKSSQLLHPGNAAGHISFDRLVFSEIASLADLGEIRASLSRLEVDETQAVLGMGGMFYGEKPMANAAKLCRVGQEEPLQSDTIAATEAFKYTPDGKSSADNLRRYQAGQCKEEVHQSIANFVAEKTEFLHGIERQTFASLCDSCECWLASQI